MNMRAILFRCLRYGLSIATDETDIRFRSGLGTESAGSCPKNLDMESDANGGKVNSKSVRDNEGAGDRTQDTRIKSPLLYQLSYASK